MSFVSYIRRMKTRWDWVERHASQGHQPVLVHLTVPVIIS